VTEISQTVHVLFTERVYDQVIGRVTAGIFDSNMADLPEKEKDRQKERGACNLLPLD
jgi:hypothetical protein